MPPFQPKPRRDDPNPNSPEAKSYFDRQNRIASGLYERMGALASQTGDTEGLSTRAIYPLNDEAGEPIEENFTRAWVVEEGLSMSLFTDQVRCIGERLVYQVVDGSLTKHVTIFAHGEVEDFIDGWKGRGVHEKVLSDTDLTIQEIEKKATQDKASQA